MYTILAAEPAGELKADQCSEAVAEEGKWFVQEWDQGFSEGLDKRRELSKRRLHQPSSPSRKLNRADLDIPWQIVRPGTKNNGAGARIRKTKQTKTGLSARLAE